jgi:hypothetical protein
VQFLIVAHGFGIFASLANALPWIYQVFSLAVVGLSFFSSLRHHYNHNISYQIRYNKDSTWSLAIRNNVFQALEILPTSVITRFLIVLHCRFENGKPYNLVIFKDALNEKDYRALVLILKIAGLNHDTP